MIRAVEKNIATIQYQVVEILSFLYFFEVYSYIVAINGGMARGKYPIRSGNNRFDTNAIIMIHVPVARAI